MRLSLLNTFRSTLAAALLLSATVVTAIAHQGHGLVPAASPVATAGGWEIVDERVLDIDGRLVTLSPDGRWIAGLNDDFLFCVWDVETLEAMCDQEREPIDTRSIAWAPDSSAVAYSLDALIQLADSDLFVFEVAEGVSANITDDGFRDRIPFNKDEHAELGSLPIDIYPAWSADSTSLIFARSDWLLEEPTTEIMAIARKGGEPEFLRTVSEHEPFTITSPMLALENGTIALSVWPRSPGDPLNGIWLLEPDGAFDQLMTGDADSAYPLPYLLDAMDGPDGPVVSGYSYRRFGERRDATSISFQVNLENGEVTPGLGDADAQDFSYGLRYSPDGTSTVSFTILEGEPRIIITASGGGTTILELEPRSVVLSEHGVLRGIDWADNNTLLLSDQRGGGLLITVAPGGEGSS